MSTNLTLLNAFKVLIKTISQGAHLFKQIDFEYDFCQRLKVL